MVRLGPKVRHSDEVVRDAYIRCDPFPGTVFSSFAMLHDDVGEFGVNNAMKNQSTRCTRRYPKVRYADEFVRNLRSMASAKLDGYHCYVLTHKPGNTTV